MAFISVAAPEDALGIDTHSKITSPNLAKRLCDAGQFLRDLRVRIRFGELTRAPLRLLRFQVLEDLAECDWGAREPDPWDAELPRAIGQRHASLQALRDAIDVRNLLFNSIPELNTAVFRVYRSHPIYDKLIITGKSERKDGNARSVHSLAMRAHLLGFRFLMQDGLLHELQPDVRLDLTCTAVWHNRLLSSKHD